MIIKKFDSVYSSELRAHHGYEPDVLQLRIVDDQTGGTLWMGERVLPEQDDADRTHFKRVKAWLLASARKHGY